MGYWRNWCIGLSHRGSPNYLEIYSKGSNNSFNVRVMDKAEVGEIGHIRGGSNVLDEEGIRVGGFWRDVIKRIGFDYKCFGGSLSSSDRNVESFWK